MKSSMLPMAWMALTFWTAGSWALAQPPLPKALESAAIVQDRLDDIMENSLILGNGDLNGLLYVRGGQLVLKLTKNDVWDARVDTSKDPPLLKIDIRNGKLTGPLHGPMPSWDKPYPCPRPCAYVVFGADGAKGAIWRQIRREGTVNAFACADGRATMRIEGRQGASNGWAVEPLGLPAARAATFHLKVSGSPNAQYYVDICDSGQKYFVSSKWIRSPQETEEKVFSIPPGHDVHRLILYTWTLDGKPAENRFEAAWFDGPGGKVPVDLSNVGKMLPCPSRLDIARSVARADHPDTPATVRCLAGQNVFLIDTPASARLEGVPAGYLPAPQHTAHGKDGSESVTQVLPADPDWPGLTFAVALAQRNARKAVSVVTSLEAKDPQAKALDLVRLALAAEPSSLIAEHEKLWADFWSASGVQLDDADLTRIWYRCLYFLRCVSKPGVEAIGLYASLTNDSPPWHGSHTLNYNSEQTFWSAYVTNHVELAEPYERMIHRYLPRARWFARQTYDCDGACIPHNVFTHEVPDPTICKSRNNRMHAFPPYAHTIGVSGMVVQNLWWHYKYQPERDYLERIAYPAVRDVATFYAEFIERCRRAGDGKVVLAPSYSPEHWSLTPDFKRNRNSTFCIAYARFTLKAAIEGAAALGCDEPLARRWQAALELLPAYPVSEGEQPIVVDVLDAPPINYNIAVPAVPVFPAEQVTIFSDSPTRALFVRTLEQVKWNGYNASMIMPIARARLSLPDTWSYAKREFLARSRPNGTITLRAGDHCGHFTEQFAASAAISELLLQSVEGIIRVLPAWPADKPAQFVRLRAMGGFLVTAEQAGGKIAPVRVTSTVGGALRLVSPWPGVAVRRRRGPAQALSADARGIVTIDTQPGEELLFEPR